MTVGNRGHSIPWMNIPVAETIIATLLRIGETVALSGAGDPDVGQWNGSYFEMNRRTRLNYI